MRDKYKYLLKIIIIVFSVLLLGFSKTLLCANIFIAWWFCKKINKGYSVMFFFLPLLSLIILLKGLTSNFDFYQYIFVFILSAISFVSVWIVAAVFGDENKVELSMYIVGGFVLIFFMLFMALTEVLPNEILEFYLKPLIAKGNTYDIWSRPPYQLAHFVVMAVSFPYFASFVFGKVILKFRAQISRRSNSNVT